MDLVAFHSSYLLPPIFNSFSLFIRGFMYLYFKCRTLSQFSPLPCALPPVSVRMLCVLPIYPLPPHYPGIPLHWGINP